MTATGKNATAMQSTGKAIRGSATVTTAPALESPPDGTDRVVRLAAARALIDREFRRRRLSLADVARAAHLSQFHFQRLFRQHYGVTPKQVITALRIAEVQRLALAGMSFKDAADAAGFAHQSHMTTRFKRAVGVTPRTWLASVRAAPARPAATDAAVTETRAGEQCGLSCGSAPRDLAAPHATPRIIPPEDRAARGAQ